VRKRIKIASLAFLIGSGVVFFVSYLVNWVVLDEFDAYGEVPIPGTQTLHLPAGDVTISFHSRYPEGDAMDGPVTVPEGIEVTIIPARAAAGPIVTASSGGDCGTNTDSHDGHCLVRVAHIPQAGDYRITTNGKVTPSVNPRLAFGHRSRFWFLSWLFGGLCVVSLVTFFVAEAGGGSASGAPDRPKTVLEQLTELASLHNSGALTEEEYEDDKRRLLDGLEDYAAPAHRQLPPLRICSCRR
jgi:hypothetical protein